MDKTETKKVYAFDSTGKYLGERLLDWTDRSPISGRWQIPAGCTDIETPKERKGYVLYFDVVKRKWTNKKEPEIQKEPETPAPTKEEKIATLDAKYEELKKDLCIKYIATMLREDTETQETIKTDLENLDDWYDSEYDKIEGEE